MKLHEAIEKILFGSDVSLTSEEIALKINEQKLYVRADGKSIPSSQISARINGYPAKFKRLENRKIVLLNKEKNTLDDLLWRVESLLETSHASHEIGTIPIILFYIRFSFFSSKSKDSEFFGKYSYQHFNNTIVDSNEFIINAYKYYSEKHSLVNWVEFVTKKINLIGTELLYEVFQIIGQYKPEQLKFSNEEFGDFFNTLLNSENRYHRQKGEFSSPIPLNKLISSLVEIKKREKFIDPFAGFGGLIINLFKHHLDKINLLFANDINADVAVLGQMNFLSNGINNCKYSIKNSLQAQTNIFETQENNFDWVCTIPPITLKSPSARKQFSNSEINSHFYVLCIQAILDMLTPNGKSIIVIPEEFLYNNDESTVHFRQKMVNDNFIKAIISLPIGVLEPYSGIKAAILFIDKNKTNTTNVNFINLNKQLFSEILLGNNPLNELVSGNTIVEGISNSVSVDEIIKNHYLLNANRYLTKIEEISPDYCCIKDLVKNSYVNNFVHRSLIKPKGTIPFIHANNLSNSFENSIVDINFINLFISNDIISKERLIKGNSNSILISQKGGEPNPTLIEGPGEFVTDSSILVLEIDTSKILPRYFISQLYSNYVIDQFNSKKAGEFITFINWEDLLSIRIKTPFKEEQQFFLDNFHPFKSKEYSTSFIISKEDKPKNISGLFDFESIESKPKKENEIKEEDLSSDAYNKFFTFQGRKTNIFDFDPSNENHLIKHLKHSFSQLNDAILTDIINLKDFIQDKANKHELILFNDKITGRENAPTLGELLNRITSTQSSSGTLINTIHSIIDLNNKEIETVQVQFNLFLEDQMTLLQGIGNNIKINIFSSLNPDELFVSIDPHQIMEMLRNLIKNACDHGYNDPEKEKTIIFEITQDEDPTYLTINYYNDGMPFSDDFTFEDFKTFGKTFGKNKGTGLGGHLISLIISKHDGNITHLPETDYFPIPDQNRSMKVGVHFKIKIPKL